MHLTATCIFMKMWVTARANRHNINFYTFVFRQYIIFARWRNYVKLDCAAAYARTCNVRASSILRCTMCSYVYIINTHMIYKKKYASQHSHAHIRNRKLYLFWRSNLYKHTHTFCIYAEKMFINWLNDHKNMSLSLARV